MSMINKSVKIVLLIIACMGIKDQTQAQFTMPVQKVNLNGAVNSLFTFKPEWAQKLYFRSSNQVKFKASDLPFFCKMENKIEKSSKIAFRFRLGDLNYVNMLENK